MNCRPTVGRQLVGPKGSGERTFTTEDFWLNEPQALLLAVLSRTKKAADIREQLIRVFLAVRKGDLAKGVAEAARPDFDTLLEELRRGTHFGHRAVQDATSDAFQTLAVIRRMLDGKSDERELHQAIRGMLADGLGYIGDARYWTEHIVTKVGDFDRKINAHRRTQ